MRRASGWAFWTLLACAMAFAFAWFDMPGHGSAFAARGAALSAVAMDGHALFLIGMLAVVVASLAAPCWLERHATAVLAGCLVAGTAALAVYCAPVAPWLVALSVVLMGFTNVLLTTAVASTVLTRVPDRGCLVLAVAASLAAKTLLVYGASRYLGAGRQTALLVATPAVCTACVLVARRLMPPTTPGIDAARAKLDGPQSSLMLGMVLVTAVIFAATRVVSNLGFWGTDYPLDAWGPLPSLAITAVYLALCYTTLVKADSRLLFRFLPALLVLFALYAFLYSDLGGQMGLSASFLAVLAQYAELYGQTFMWAVLLLGMRTLSMPPFRVVGVLFGAYTVVELLMQYFLSAFSELSLAVVLFSFFAMFGVLVWALCRFYGRDGFEEELHAASPAGGDAAGDAGKEAAPEGGPAGAGAPDTAAVRREMARDYGLSERETEVFLLLAQGRTRKFICDELFISAGTASSYTSRVYEKLGVHSKQDLLTLVLECEGAQRG